MTSPDRRGETARSDAFAGDSAMTLASLAASFHMHLRAGEENSFSRIGNEKQYEFCCRGNGRVDRILIDWDSSIPEGCFAEKSCNDAAYNP
jgi:hypothetical protein